MAHERNPVDVFPEMREFWQAAAENRLLLKRCRDCGQTHYYPRPICPYCQSSHTEWSPSSGRGTIYTFSVARRAAIPCAPVVVELEGGVRLTSVVVHADLDALHIGAEVTLHTLRGNGPPEIAFSTPQADAARAHAHRVIDSAPQDRAQYEIAGSRMFGQREQEARRLLLEGASPEQVDRVLTDFGMPQGSFRPADLAPEPGVARRRIRDDEIRNRLVLSIINEGARLLEERVTERPGDIDAAWLQAYGWPSWRGGPMYHADRIGLAELQRRLQALATEHGERFAPSPLLARMAGEGRTFFPAAAAQ